MSVGVVDKTTGDRIPTAGDPLDKVGNLANLTTTAKDNAVNAINEVNAGLATKADLTDLAPAFSTSTAYDVGQYVSYDGNIYKCTSAHSAGAWVAGDFTLVAVGSELSAINSNISHNTFGSQVDLSSYTSDDNLYVFPDDGYLCINSTTATTGTGQLTVYGSYSLVGNFGFVLNATGAWQGNATYVKRGMRVKVNSLSTDFVALFIPLTI